MGPGSDQSRVSIQLLKCASLTRFPSRVQCNAPANRAPPWRDNDPGFERRCAIIRRIRFQGILPVAGEVHPREPRSRLGRPHNARQFFRQLLRVDRVDE